MKSLKTVLLSAADISRCVNMKDALAIVEEAFRAHGEGRVQMPPKMYLRLDKYGGDLRAMPAYMSNFRHGRGGAKSFEACGIKWVNVHPENRRRGLPAVMALIILNDPETGYPLAVMDGTHITNLRTGASGGVAAKYLARKDATTVALIGCGVQAQTQLLALHELFKLTSVALYDSRNSQMSAFIRRMRHLGLRFKPCSGAGECVRGADIVVTTTPSKEPIVRSEWIGTGVHLNAIGADAKGKEELSARILARAKVVVDDRVQAAHSGEINVPISKNIMSTRDIYATLGEIVSGKKRGRVVDEEITVFDSTGLAHCDVAVAHFVYRKISFPRKVFDFIRCRSALKSQRQ